MRLGFCWMAESTASKNISSVSVALLFECGGSQLDEVISALASSSRYEYTYRLSDKAREACQCRYDNQGCGHGDSLYNDLVLIGHSRANLRKSKRSLVHVCSADHQTLKRKVGLDRDQAKLAHWPATAVSFRTQTLSVCSRYMGSMLERYAA